MAGPNEQIVVEVKDRIAPTIAPNFEKLAKSADRAQDSVDRVNRSLRALSVGKLGDISSAADKANAALDRLTRSESAAAKAASQAAIAKEKLAQATARTTAANLAASRSAQQLATAEANTARATAQASAAQDRAAISAIRLKNAQQPKPGTASGGANADLLSGIGGLAMRGGANLLAAYTIKETTQAVIGFTDAYTGLQNKLKNVTGSLETTGPLIGKIRDIANATQQPIGDVAESFARFDRSLKQLGKTQEESLGFTEGVTRLLFQFGKSGGEAASATLQLTQAMGKGKLDGDEFRSVMENLPELMTYIAQELDVTKAGLFEMSRAGKITGEVIFNAMERARKEMGNTEQPITRLDGAFTKLKNNATIFFGELETSSTFVRGLTVSIDALGDALDRFNKKTKEPLVAPAGPGGPDFDVMSTFHIPDGAGLDPDFSVKLAAARKAQAEAKKAAEDAAKAKREFEEAANKGRITAEKKWKIEKETTEFIIEQGEATQRNIELARMSESLRYEEQNLDKYKLDAQEKGIELSEGAIATQRRLYAEQYKAEQLTKKGEKGVDRAAELAKVNRHLDNEISRMHQLQAVREQASRFDAIDEQLKGKKITLDATEAAGIREKIAAIQEYSYVQAEADRIVNEANGPTRTYLATLDAASEKLAAGAISAEQYERELNRATIAIDQATDTLYDHNKAMQESLMLAGLNARDRDIEAKVLEVVNAQLAKGVSLRDINVSALRQEQIELRAMNEARSAEDEILDRTTGKQRKLRQELQAYLGMRAQLKAMGPANDNAPFESADARFRRIDRGGADPAAGGTGQDASERMQLANSFGVDLSATQTSLDAAIEQREQFYANIDELRRRDVINEQEAEAAKIRAWQTEQKAKTDLAQSFFSNFEGMQRSNVAEFAAIGKAAAISNAIIQTYVAANAAYASMAGIPGVGPALGAAAAAGAIASGMANVAAIQSQPTGYERGGYTGGGGTSEVAGVVHGQEYVMNAAATRRIGRGNLDALQNGDASGVSDGSGSGGTTTLNLSLIVVGSEEEAKQMLSGKEGDALIVKAIGRQAKTISKVLKSA